MKVIEKKRINMRISAVGLLFASFFLVVAVRAVHLQIFCNPLLVRKAVSQYEQSFTAFGKRGIIYDRNGREMAVSIDVTSVAAYPRKVEDTGSAAKVLSLALKMDRAGIQKKLAGNRAFVWVKRQVSPRETRNIKDMNLSGIDFIPEHNRFYPNRALAAQVLGFTGIDGKGLEGIEFYYEKFLKGKVVKRKVLKDALGGSFYIEARKSDSFRGKNLILTIDKTIQYITEKALKEAVVKASAKSGIAIVMDPATGDVLSLAHYPFYNPNAFGKFDKDFWRNRAITDPFEPGSIMKIFSAAAAIESGVCQAETRFFCENGRYQVGDDFVHDIKPRGWLDLKHIIKYSSNIGAVKVGEAVGSQELHKRLGAFGFGRKTGIDCPGETSGSLFPYERWSKIDAGAISFGHGISVSSIQLISAVSAIANNGILMKPRIVQAITDANGKHLQSFGPLKVRRVISGETATVVKDMMKSVLEKGGTGVKAALNGYSACGKTGTARKLDETGAYVEGKCIASFIGFAPAENAKAAILVVIDEPMKDLYAGDTAAPVFRKITHELLNYINLPPRNDSDRLTVSIDAEVNG